MAVCHQGERAASIYYVQSGRIKLALTSDTGKEATIGVVGPHNFFGEAALTSMKYYHYSAIALEPAVVTVVSVSAMRSLMIDDRDISAAFLRHLVRRNRELEEELAVQMIDSVEKRLARLLLRLAEFGIEGEGAVVPVWLTHNELATMIGATRSRVTKFMAKFRRLGYISYDGHVEVHQSLEQALKQGRTLDAR